MRNAFTYSGFSLNPKMEAPRLNFLSIVIARASASPRARLSLMPYSTKKEFLSNG